MKTVTYNMEWPWKFGPQSMQCRQQNIMTKLTGIIIIKLKNNRNYCCCRSWKCSRSCFFVALFLSCFSLNEIDFCFEGFLLTGTPFSHKILCFFVLKWFSSKFFAKYCKVRIEEHFCWCVVVVIDVIPSTYIFAPLVPSTNIFAALEPSTSIFAGVVSST